MTEHRVHEPTCRSCGVRMRKAPLPRDSYRPLFLKRAEVMWLENAARYFDADSDQYWTAEEFIAWLKPDLTGKFPPIPPERSGHGNPDPIPFVTTPAKMRRVG